MWTWRGGMSTAACSRWSIGASSGIFWITRRYFRRGALYGQMDDGERFAFFSKAVVSVLPMLEWRPEVIHCNDWQDCTGADLLENCG